MKTRRKICASQGSAFRIRSHHTLSTAPNYGVKVADAVLDHQKVTIYYNGQTYAKWNDDRTAVLWLPVFKARDEAGRFVSRGELLPSGEAVFTICGTEVGRFDVADWGVA